MTTELITNGNKASKKTGVVKMEKTGVKRALELINSSKDQEQAMELLQENGIKKIDIICWVAFNALPSVKNSSSK